jgi:hypothetical protein
LRARAKAKLVKDGHNVHFHRRLGDHQRGGGASSGRLYGVPTQGCRTMRKSRHFDRCRDSGTGRRVGRRGDQDRFFASIPLFIVSGRRQ